MFFNCFTSCCSITIHHIHIYSDCLCLNYRLNFYYYHKFPMRLLLHLNKLWIVYHFYVHSNHRCGMYMKMSFVVFDLVVLLFWLPLWSILSFFYMFPHYDSSYHKLCNIYQSPMYYSMVLLVLLVWYSMVLKIHSLLLQ